MYIVDGIAYAGEPTEDMKVESARYMGGFVFLVTFSTGETRLFDVTSLFEYPVFQPLSDEQVAQAFAIDRGVLTWCDGEVDIAPEALYALGGESSE